MFRKVCLVLFISAALLAPLNASGQELPDFKTLIDTEAVMSHVRALSVAIGARLTGSDAEMHAAEYIAAALNDWGYEVEIQEFETDRWDEEEEEYQGTVSRNVIATKPGDDGVVVVGAHMDSVTAGTGAGDNGSGVGAMLAVAEAIADMDTARTVIFVAFGGEENGDPSGAEYYVQSLGDEINDVVAMLNIDAVGMGTRLNAYAGAKVIWVDEYEEELIDFYGGPMWVRDLVLDWAAEMGYAFGTTPDESWGGYIGDWSDHHAFADEDIPVVYIDAWQWEGEGVEDPWSGVETSAGDILHTSGDVYENVIAEQVEMAAEVLAFATATIAVGDAP
jgi:alkaline phosphatase isozyme conversion protein